MLLSLEIPVKHVKEFILLTDFSFGLAHLFLQKYPEYSDYEQTHTGCLLDNSMYELGESLTNDQLVEAAAVSHCGAVIAPDWMDDFGRTMDATLELIRKRPQGARWTVGGVVQGRNYEERRKCFVQMHAQHCSPICFPFRTPRNETISRLLAEGRLGKNQWYHLLGLQQLQELQWRLPGVWSLDTAKPFKGYRMDAAQEIRGHGKIDLFGQLDLTKRRTAGWNIAFMRKLAAYDETQGLTKAQRRKRKDF